MDTATSRSPEYRLARSLGRAAESRFFAYAALVLLQSKVMWGIWRYRDLAPGDTSYYYMDVFRWLSEGKANVAWSPFYTLFLAALHKLLGGPFWVVTVAQVLVALGASILVLATLRRLVPKHVAWLLAAWWVLLPINFDTAYSVHLFGALFPLALFAVAARWNNVYGRGAVFGGLLLTAVLVRTEYGALLAGWILVAAAYEVYAHRREARLRGATYLFAYGVPCLAALLVIGLFWTRARPAGYSEFLKEVRAKHIGNVCQIYAYNRMQQGDRRIADPWLECETLMERDFGRADVTFAEAFRLNPPAILGHLWWNTKLIPSGTQLALFDYFAGGPNPDYMRAKASHLVWLPFSLVLGLGCLGVVRCFVLPLFGKGPPIQNGFAWLFLFSAALLVVVVMVTQRPRPSYMFPYTLFLMALTGLGLQRCFELTGLDGLLERATPVIALSLLLLYPPHYHAEYVNYYGYTGQPLRASYERVAPYIPEKSRKAPLVIVTPMGDESLCNYLGAGSGQAVQYSRIAGPFFQSELEALNVNWIYLDSSVASLPLRYVPSSWKIVSEGATHDERWVLLGRAGKAG
ncbi:MAG: hypothetical protein HY900_24610 [Deltaproteobacteria bacterium]|nr:hypothetical protein [Deltaproteobacteria bacterium]